MVHAIHLDIGEVQRRGGDRGASPATERPDAREQLVEGERLGQVVVGAAVETANDVLRRVASREHEDGNRRTLAAQLGRDREAVLLRELHVELEHVVRIDVSEDGALVAVAGHVHRMALLLQPLPDEAGDLAVVLHDEDAHASNLPSRFAVE